MASEFKQDNNFTFAASAYSVVDRLLEIAMNNPTAASNFKILLNATVDRLEFDDQGQAVKRVVLKGGIIKLQTKHVVLCAGSVHGAAILLRSGVNIASGGGRLTDHNIYQVERKFSYSDDPPRKEVGSMRLQTYATLGTSNEAAIASITVDSSAFSSRDHPTNNSDPNFQIIFILTSILTESPSFGDTKRCPGQRMDNSIAFPDLMKIRGECHQFCKRL
jgi:hypothetical protein